jgi:hypothetical protein
MELKVMVQGPDTVHPIVVTAADDEDPVQKLSSAIAQNHEVVRFGESAFRTDRVVAVIVTHSYVDSGRNAW